MTAAATDRRSRHPAAGGVAPPRRLGAHHWTRALVSLLGVFEILMAVSAGPVVTVIVGVVGGLALFTAPWLTGRRIAAAAVLLLVGAVPFAVLTWWSLASPLLGAVALVLGAVILRTMRSARPATPGASRPRPGHEEAEGR